MTPYQVGKAYIALKAHFTKDSYDVIRSNGRINYPRAKFEERKDRHRCEKMAINMRDDEIVKFFVANFSRKPDYSGLFDDQSETRYREWCGYIESLSYNYGNEVKSLLLDAKDSQMCYNDVFVGAEGQHPPVLNAYMGKQISIETFIILDRLNRFTDNITVDVVSEDTLRIARKYSPFLKVDLETYDNITRTVREQVFE